ncbi:MAG: exodeoxyribonuclease I [Gammaproteobacteria bacterium]|nr:exodeoxyribonuclease I [Gammaproteobacteria bacterium]MBT4492596.1 exodeoxyribonuclease I [Gammaproteobacteria bacterium]MBT7369738.1 exodeoxyribonuclease I [Gammaproteobacteria bacterium]
MTETIYWYDLETTGTDPILDRPLQFAGVRTDLDLIEISPPQNILCRPGNDVVPEPGAMLVTGILMSEMVEKGIIERDFVTAVLSEFNQPQTCVAGFNNLRFDDEFTRQMLYRNLCDPYAREWRSGNSRWDVIDLFRAAYALRPDGFEWPEREPGIPSFRLEHLTQANGIEHVDAHDALGDVRATIAVTRLLREAQSRLYDFAFRLKDKKAVLQQLYPLGKEAVVHVSSMYPAVRGCTAIVLPICQHPENNNAVICYDLSQAPTELLNANPMELARLVFSTRDDLEEGEERIALKTIHINRSPIVAPLGTLGEAEARRIGIDRKLCEEHFEQIRHVSGLVEKIQEAYSSRRFQENDDPDFRLYDGGFFSDADRKTMDAVTDSPAEQILSFTGRFQDDRLDEMLFRYLARNWPELLDGDEKLRWQSHCLDRWRGGDNLDRVAEEIQGFLDDGEIGESDKTVLKDLDGYISGLRESVGLVSA